MSEVKYALTVDIVLEAPVMLAEAIGARNHLETLDHIPGSSLRGIFAWRYITQNHLGENAHQNPAFRSLFLQPGLHFLAGKLGVGDTRTQLVPQNIRKTKDHDPVFVDEFNPGSNSQPRKYKSGYFAPGEPGVHSPAKRVYFHMSRFENPIAGHAVEGNVFT